MSESDFLYSSMTENASDNPHRRDHPNARHQKRHHEESGPFGKRVKRKGSRSITPAKKENPTLDGFEKALKYDQERAAAEAQEKSNSSKSHNEIITSVSSSIKVPTEVALYGFAPGTHWAAINFYERASIGYICEDYDRDPPIERRRIPNAFAAAQMVRSRALTKQEAVLARQYHGGNCWIKVTFDSAESADRAINCSPHQIQGHWVYAELFRGVQPNHPDEPIPLQKEDLGRGPYGSAAPASRVSRSLGPSFTKNNKLQTRPNPNLSSSLTGLDMVQVDSQEPRDGTPRSSSTATSATATAPGQNDLRNRIVNQPVQTPTPHPRDPRYFTHFPDVPRTVLRPAHEAFLPQPTWLESCFQRLYAMGLLPGDMIGNGPPFLDNGEFDWASASLYWKVFYWLDSHLWTNFCGAKDT